MLGKCSPDEKKPLVRKNKKKNPQMGQPRSPIMPQIRENPKDGQTLHKGQKPQMEKHLPKEVSKQAEASRYAETPDKKKKGSEEQSAHLFIFHWILSHLSTSFFFPCFPVLTSLYKTPHPDAPFTHLSTLLSPLCPAHHPSPPPSPPSLGEHGE